MSSDARLTLRARVLLLGLVISAALVAVLVQVMVEHRRALQAQITEGARAVAGSVHAGIVYPMTEGDGAVVRDQLVTLKRDLGRGDVVIYGHEKRKAAYASRPDMEGVDFNQALSSPALSTALERALFSGAGSNDVFEETIGGRRYVTVLRMMPNSAECHHCHNEASEQNGAVVLVRQDVEEAYASLANQTWKLAGALVLVVGVLTVGLWLMARSIVVSLRTVKDLAERTAAGDLTAEVSAREGGDELDEVLRAVARMRRQLKAMVAAIQHGAGVMRSAMEQLASTNEEVEQQTQGQVVRIKDAASTIEELSSTVGRNAQTALKVDAEATETASAAQASGDAMQSLSATLNQVTDSAKRIREVTELIDEVAFQTNILALNASVEAARAGEHGRGFSVVAAEVRSLSMRTASSAKEIKRLVASAMSEIGRGAAEAHAARDVVAGVVLQAKDLAALVSDITSANQEQARALDAAASAVTDIGRATVATASVVARGAAAARSLAGETRELARAVAQFTVDNQEPNASPSERQDEGRSRSPQDGDRVVELRRSERGVRPPKAA